MYGTQNAGKALASEWGWRISWEAGKSTKPHLSARNHSYLCSWQKESMGGGRWKHRPESPGDCRCNQVLICLLRTKNLPAKQETWVQSLSWEDPLEEDMATHSSISAWRIPMDRGAWRANLWGRNELEMTGRLSTVQSFSCRLNKMHP